MVDINGLRCYIHTEVDYCETGDNPSLKWTILLKEAASLLWYFYRDPLRSLTLLSLNVSSQ